MDHHHSAHDHAHQHMSLSSGHEGHDKHAGHNVADFWKWFIISTIVSIPVLALSPMVQQLLGFELTFPGDKYVLAILSTFIFFMADILF